MPGVVAGMAGKPQAENQQHREAYEAFVRLSQPRSVLKLAAQTPVPYRTLAGWAIRYNWRERALAHDRALVNAAANNEAERVASLKAMGAAYQAVKVTLGQYAASVQARQKLKVSVTEREVLTALQIKKLLEENWMTDLKAAAALGPS